MTESRSQQATPTAIAFRACTSPLVCPDADGCSWNSPNGRVMTIQCNKDYYGGDSINRAVQGYFECVGLCLNSDGPCVAVSFKTNDDGTAGGRCYLKNHLNIGVYSPNINGKCASQIISLLLQRISVLLLPVWPLTRCFRGISQQECYRCPGSIVTQATWCNDNVTGVGVLNILDIRNIIIITDALKPRGTPQTSASTESNQSCFI